MSKKRSTPRNARPSPFIPMQLPLFGLRAKPGGAVDNRRLNESDPLLRAIWLQLRENYFPDRPDIDDYLVVWSRRRQRRTLASCSTDQRKVRVARELNTPLCAGWLDPLLYHEMCHAYLGSSGTGGCHNRAFKALEQRHPLIPSLDAWIKAGGWLRAVRGERARSARKKRGEA